MSEPPLSACATLVRRLDPDLFHAALFAPEPARQRLMVLYAFDIELSRAAARSAEPLIAAMRLQWWRDVVAGIAAGEAAQQHEVAEPLHGLLSAHALPADDLERLIDAREIELHGPMDEPRFAEWLDGRFGALTRLAAHLLVGENAAARRAHRSRFRSIVSNSALWTRSCIKNTGETALTGRYRSRSPSARSSTPRRSSSSSSAVGSLILPPIGPTCGTGQLR